MKLELQWGVLMNDVVCGYGGVVVSDREDGNRLLYCC